MPETIGSISRECRDEISRQALDREDQFRLLVDMMPQLAWMANADGYIFWYNRRWYEYTNTTTEQMEGWGWQSVHDPGVLPGVLEGWQTSIRTGEPFEMEFPLRGGDGVFRWFLTRVSPMRDSEGSIARWFGTNTDVTDIRLAREFLREREAEGQRLNEQLERRVQRKNTELRESGERFRVLIENIQDHAILMLDCEGLIAAWNGAAERMQGYTAAEIVGKHFSLFYTLGDINAGLPERILRTAAEHGYSEHQGLRVRKDGSQFWAKVMFTALHDESGSPAGFSKMIRDISAGKRVEEELRRQTEKLKQQAALLELAHDAIFLRTVGTSGILFWNAGAAELYGWSVEQALGRSSHELLRTIFPQPLSTIEAEVHRSGRWEGELIHTRSDGSVITVASRWALQRDDRAEPVAVMEINRDITGQKDAEKALRDLHHRLNLALKGGRIGTWTWETGDDVMSCDDHLPVLFGLQPGMIVADVAYFASLVHADDRAYFYAELAKGRQTGTYESEFRVPWPSGEAHFIAAHAEASSEGGRSPKMTGVCWDITGRKTAETALRTSEAKLKAANRDLRSFSKRLEQSNRELQDFASVASHDLQEPLRKIQALGDRLKALSADALSEQGQDYVNRMLNAARRMQVLIRDLLAFSRVTSQARPFVAVDLAVVAREVLSDLEVRIAETGATVEVGNLPSIDADPVQMRQLLQNLIGNSLKFHKKGLPPAIRVHEGSADLPDGGSSLLRLLVEDNGIGFDEKYLDRIFTVFQRLHGRDEYEGTGVGLAICHKIAHRHGGSITATSAPGEGAQFAVVLPRRHAPEREQAMDEPVVLGSYR